MLSAVENYGSAAAATHAYVHHHNFSIAAAAAAAGTAAAAAAAVMPSQQAALEHHHHLLAAHSSLSGAGLLMPSASLPGSLPSPEGSTSTISPRGFLTSSSSLVNNKIVNNNSIPSGSAAVTMSSTEFLRPHPKQPRYNGSSLTSNSLSSPNNPATSPNSGNDISGSGNGIPLNVRSNKIGNSSLNLSNSPPSRSKYSSEQSGPVNLATSNNNNGGNGGNSSHPVKNSQMESLPPSHSPSERERELIAGMYAAKNLSFPPTDPSTANAVFHYSRALAANRSLYADPAFFVAHSLARGQLHTRPPYLPDQFPTYLHPAQSAYSPPGATSLLGPPSAPSVVSPQLGSPHSASSLLSNSHNSSTNSSLSTTQLPVASERYPHAASSSLHHPSSHIPQPSAMVTERQQPPYAKEKDMKNVNQLNGKANMLLENQAGFKVPSGKEGSMKHRILTRPQYGEKDIGRHRSPISAAAMRSSNSTNPLTNFTKGSLIELSTGELRRVEDMRTEDFVQSAERSPHLELADSTVVKISSNSHNVAITFSYNKNRSKVDIDASVEHPFFVYGQGWASCNPELTFKTYGLKCQRLQVGDVCISLKPRESSSPSSNSYQSMPQSPSNYPSPNQQYKDDNGPQNLSRKSSSTSSNSHTTTIPTTATGTAVCSRLSVAMPQIPPISGMPSHAPGSQSYEMIHAYGTSPPVSSHNAHHMSPNTIITQQLSHHQQHQLQRQQIEGHVVLARNSNNRPSPPSPLSAGSRPGSNQQPYYLGASPAEKCNGREQSSSNCGNIESSQLMSGDQQAAIDASTTRKRRWSWSNLPVQGNEERNGATPPKTSCSINS